MLFAINLLVFVTARITAIISVQSYMKKYRATLRILHDEASDCSIYKL